MRVPFRHCGPMAGSWAHDDGDVNLLVEPAEDGHEPDDREPVELGLPYAREVGGSDTVASAAARTVSSCLSSTLMICATRMIFRCSASALA